MSCLQRLSEEIVKRPERSAKNRRIDFFSLFSALLSPIQTIGGGISA
jgi:hypothetical protein